MPASGGGRVRCRRVGERPARRRRHGGRYVQSPGAPRPACRTCRDGVAVAEQWPVSSREVKVVPAGSGSLRVTSCASEGPLLVVVIVQVMLCPAITWVRGALRDGQRGGGPDVEAAGVGHRRGRLVGAHARRCSSVSCVLGTSAATWTGRVIRPAPRWPGWRSSSRSSCTAAVHRHGCLGQARPGETVAVPAV